MGLQSIFNSQKSVEAMTKPLKLNPDRLFPADPAIRAVARSLYEEVAGLPIVSPHGHTDPSWFAADANWTNATELLLAPDHYLYRMLYSQGIPLERLGVPSRQGASAADPREAWRLFASHYYLFRGTPSRMWLDHVFATVFGLTDAAVTTSACVQPKIPRAARRPAAVSFTVLMNEI